jgi:hypothetical protein
MSAETNVLRMQLEHVIAQRDDAEAQRDVLLAALERIESMAIAPLTGPCTTTNLSQRNSSVWLKASQALEASQAIATAKGGE